MVGGGKRGAPMSAEEDHSSLKTGALRTLVAVPVGIAVVLGGMIALMYAVNRLRTVVPGVGILGGLVIAGGLLVVGLYVGLRVRDWLASR